MSAATSDMVRARVVALSRPHLASEADLLSWLEDLTPDRYASVVDVVLRVPARRTTRRAPGGEYPRESLRGLCEVARD